MAMRRSLPRAHVALVASAVALGACDCDDAIRKRISNPGDRRGDADMDPTGQPLSSDPREREPNDAEAQATPVELGAELRAVLATIEKRGDADWYALSAPEGELIELTLDPKSEELDLVVELLGDASLRYDLEPVGEPEVVPVLAVGATPLLLRVSAKEGAGDYALRFKRRLSGGAIEAEPNDTAARAQSLTAPGEIQGFYDRVGDRDVFALTLPEGGEAQRAVYALEISGVDEVAQRAELFLTQGGEPALTLDVPAGQTTRLPNLALPPGQRQLWIALSAPEAMSRERAYHLKLTSPAPSKPGQLLEREPNDAAATPSPVALPAGADRVEVLGFIHRDGDEDHYTLQLGDVSAPDASDEGVEDTGAAPDLGAAPQPDEDAAAAADMGLPPRVLPTPDELLGAPDMGGGVDMAPALALPPLPTKARPAHLIELVVTPRDEQLHLGLVWGEGALQRAPKAGAPVSVCHVPLEDGTYPFAVRPVARPAEIDTDAYVVSIVDHASEAQRDAEIEPNDTRERADRAPVGGEVRGFIASASDRDVFAFDVPPAAGGASMRRVTVKVGPHPLDLAMRLQDDQGGSLGDVQRAGAGGEESFALSLPPGRYFVEVRSEDGTRCEPYALRVQVAP